MKQLYFLTVLVLCSLSLSSQSISEQLGAVKTNFIITSNSLTLNIEQILIPRAVAKSGHYTTPSMNVSYTKLQNSTAPQIHTYGYGYQSFHLEFIAEKQISTIRANGKKRTYYLLHFLDINEELISSFELSSAMVNFIPNKGSKAWSYIYSIDLKNVPIVVLDRTQQLKITRYDLARSY